MLYNSKEAASFFSGRSNVGTNPDLAFASFGQDSRLPDRRVLGNFLRSEHRPSLITPPKQKVSCLNVIEFYDLRFEILAGVATDRAPSMIDEYIALMVILKKQDPIDRNAFIDYHCVIIQEHLCAKTLRFDAVMKVVHNVVKFIRERL